MNMLLFCMPYNIFFTSVWAVIDRGGRGLGIHRTRWGWIQTDPCSPDLTLNESPATSRWSNPLLLWSPPGPPPPTDPLTTSGTSRACGRCDETLDVTQDTGRMTHGGVCRTCVRSMSQTGCSDDGCPERTIVGVPIRCDSCGRSYHSTCVRFPEWSTSGDVPANCQSPFCGRPQCHPDVFERGPMRCLHGCNPASVAHRPMEQCTACHREVCVTGDHPRLDSRTRRCKRCDTVRLSSHRTDWWTSEDTDQTTTQPTRRAGRTT